MNFDLFWQVFSNCFQVLAGMGLAVLAIVAIIFIPCMVAALISMAIEEWQMKRK